MYIVQEVPLEHRCRLDNLDAHEREIIAGALNRYSVSLPFKATPDNLSAFTWEQVLQALQASRRDCVGASLDDLDDVIYAVRDERKRYTTH